MTDTIAIPRKVIAGVLYALDLSQALLESTHSIHHTTVLEEYKSLRAALEQQVEQGLYNYNADPSCTTVELAEMILSDCGCSSNNTSLVSRVANRIDTHILAEQPVREPYDKTEMNAFAQELYVAKMREGKHGHYEILFHVVHKSIERAQHIGVKNEEN